VTWGYPILFMGKIFAVYLINNSVMNGIAEIDFVQLDAELINEFIILVQLLFLMTLKSLIFQG
jgi:hypothetical protein